MADGDYFDILSSSDQIRQNYENYKDKYVESGTNGIDSETFLKLLVAEMSNQDPLEPTSNTEFISQLAQFSAMGYMQEAGKYAQANYASSLVGKTVTASKVDGKDVVIITGVVEKVTKNKDNSYSVTVDGEEFSLDKISSVSETAPKKDEDDGDKTETVTPSALGDSISRAAAMVGMYATVQVDSKITQGFVEAIQVKDGKINVVVNGFSQPIENVLEVTYATIVDDPENPEDPDGTENDENGEKVDGVDGSEENNGAAGGIDTTTGGEDIPDLPDSGEEELASRIQDIINSMS